MSYLNDAKWEGASRQKVRAEEIICVKTAPAIFSTVLCSPKTSTPALLYEVGFNQAFEAVRRSLGAGGCQHFANNNH